MPIYQCCESRSGRIRNFFPDPELFVSEPDPARMKERNNTLLILGLWILEAETIQILARFLL